MLAFIDRPTASPVEGEVPVKIGSNKEVKRMIVARSLGATTVASPMLYCFSSRQINATQPTNFIACDDYITALPVAGYILLHQIPVQLKQVDEGDWIASFEEANIGISGSTAEEAKEALAYSILDIFDIYLREEEALIPKLKSALDVLRTYIQVHG